MGTRENIYYWKSDNPLPLEERRIYNNKYEQADISKDVELVAESFFGRPVVVKSTGSAGNHYAYTLDVGDEKYFFRAADDRIDDDYILAESAVMRLLAQHNVPVPEVITVDISREAVPFRFQILEWREEKCLNVFYQDRSIDQDAIAYQLGIYLSRIHSVTRPGFGFFNTAELAASGKICGTLENHRKYFQTCLNQHLAYLSDHSLLTEEQTNSIEERLESLSSLTDIPEGRIVHRDIALWNILGKRDCITAIIDWDDVVIGDPADDFGILNCFYDNHFLDQVKKGYQTEQALPENLDIKLPLYTLRNMLWKAMIRHYMGYFEQTGNFFILNDDNRGSLRQFTIDKIMTALEMLKED